MRRDGEDWCSDIRRDSHTRAGVQPAASVLRRERRVSGHEVTARHRSRLLSRHVVTTRCGCKSVSEVCLWPIQLMARVLPLISGDVRKRDRPRTRVSTRREEGGFATASRSGGRAAEEASGCGTPSSVWRSRTRSGKAAKLATANRSQPASTRVVADPGPAGRRRLKRVLQPTTRGLLAQAFGLAEHQREVPDAEFVVAAAWRGAERSAGVCGSVWSRCACSIAAAS